MFFLIRIIVWVAGVTVLAHFVLGFFGYGINPDYFTDNKKTCQEKILSCQKELVETGTEATKEKSCDIDCFDLKLLIHKK